MAYCQVIIDIGIFYTTLLETNEWVKGDQATGRLSIIPNSFVLSGVVNNYTKDHPYIWDEISIPITYDSDWKEALKIIEAVIDVETRDSTSKSEKSNLAPIFSNSLLELKISA